MVCRESTCGATARTFEAWNTRAPDPLREALLWFHAAENHAHRLGWCDEDNGATGPGDIPCRTCAEIADMRNTAADEVERLLGEMR